MNELIKVNFDENSERPTVLGRDLHEVLGIKTEYKKWFDRMTEYGFSENEDYLRVTQKCHTLGGVQNITNHLRWFWGVRLKSLRIRLTVLKLKI